MVATADGAAPFQLLDPTKVGYGVATAYLAPAGEAMPADTINMGVAWGGNWLAVGSTDDGVHMGWTPATSDLTIEEQATPVAVLLDTVDLTWTLTFAEDVLANIKIALGVGSIATTAPGVGLVGKSVLTLGNTLNKYAFGLEMANPSGHWRRISVPGVVSVGSVTTDFRRTANKRMYPTTFRTICDPRVITFTDKTAESTG